MSSYTVFAYCTCQVAKHHLEFVCFWRNTPPWAMASSFMRRITLKDPPLSVGFLWTGDQLVAEASN